MNENKLANPGALGLGGFALTTFLLSVVNTGIIPAASIGMVLPMVLFYGGLAQVLAGMWEIKTGNIFGATCFTSFGTFWLGLATNDNPPANRHYGRSASSRDVLFPGRLGHFYPLRHHRQFQWHKISPCPFR